MRQHVRLYEGPCINNPHYEKSNLLHLPANYSHAAVLDWCDRSFFKALTSDEGGCNIRREKMEGGVRLLMANGVLN